ncbi:hypothetical protein ACP6PL_15285 [Dapis sp. BLCC M126]|uniref:hypothetical protein n=1 Tax=Dapis sp. BLCC M126 TaxID=3400189 RepID=UPI003CED26EF
MSTQFKSVFPFVNKIFATTITLATTALFTTGDAAAISITSTVNSNRNIVPVVGTSLQDGDFLLTLLISVITSDSEVISNLSFSYLMRKFCSYQVHLEA